MKEKISIPTNTTQSQRMVDYFPIEGKLLNYTHVPELQTYNLEIQTKIGIETKVAKLFFRNNKDFSSNLDMIKNRHFVTIKDICLEPDCIEQPDGTSQTLPKVVRIASYDSAFQTENVLSMYLK